MLGGMDALPHWPPGTVALLATGAGTPHVIPVSTALRAGDDRVLLALAHRRESLRRLREDPAAALALLAEGDVACTAYGTARVVADPLPGAENVVGVELRVEAVQDHGSSRFQIDEGVRWHWVDADAERGDASTRAALRALLG
jgi:hypothetical protein